MEAKEIDVLAIYSRADGFCDAFRIDDAFSAEHDVGCYEDAFIAKAKLIIEIPEKKIEITESEFDRVVEKYSQNRPYGFHVVSAVDIKQAKKELGF